VLHFADGQGCTYFFKEKMDLFDEDIKEWYDVITGTDHDDVVSSAT